MPSNPHDSFQCVQGDDFEWSPKLRPLKKVRPAPGEEPAARTRSGDGEGWGRDRGRKLLVSLPRDQRDVAVAGVPRGSPSETHTF
jgi:hypothetical protein